MQCYNNGTDNNADDDADVIAKRYDVLMHMQQRLDGRPVQPSIERMRFSTVSE